MKGTIEERFFDKVFPEPMSGCWLWVGSRSNGYGRFNKGPGFEIIPAHRFSYELHKNKIPDGMHVCHHCDNPCCVNPDHLFVGTHLQNQQDKIKKGRQKTKLRSKDIFDIREEYENNKITLEELGEKYVVHFVTIHDIVRNKTWRHL